MQYNVIKTTLHGGGRMRQTNQKLKLYYLEKILREQTDEQHPLTIAELTEKLASYGILVERKTLYADLECLQLAKLDIQVTKGRGNKYALVSREFELPELKLLVDAVQSCRFITEKKSATLIKKLESLTSVHEAKRMSKQVFIYRRVKSANEKVYYTIDTLNNAIADGKKVQFHYFEYTPDKRRRLKNNGDYYVVSPHALCWDDEYYYLICTYPAREGFTHFRVDKILDITMLDEPAEKQPEDFDPAQYSRQTFSMFGGQECRAALRFDNSLIGVAIDRFGADILIRPDGDKFITYVNVTKSPTFYGWMFQLGDKAEILGPEDLRAGMREHVCSVAKLYGC
jgi:predicted DNA-binding transcriptional regulator YafY